MGKRTGITVRKTIFFAVWYSIWTLSYWIFYVASRPGLSLGEYLTAIMPIAAVIGLMTLGVYASLIMPTWVAAAFYLPSRNSAPTPNAAAGTNQPAALELAPETSSSDIDSA